MKTTKFLIPICLLSVVLMLPPTTSAQFSILTNNGAITITAYNGSSKSVVIPNVTNGYPVTTIGPNAFYFNSTLTNVVIGSNATSIGSQAFANCISLISATIGSGVTNIASEAFANCGSALRSIYFQGNAPNVGSNVFGGDYSATLGSVVVYYLPGTTNWGPRFGTGSGPTANGVPAYLPFPPFNCITENGSITVNQYSGTGGSVIIPSTVNGLPVTRVGDITFYFASSLTNVTIPSSVTSIGTNAFSFCSSLTSMILPNSLTNICDNAFNNCSNLKNVTLGTNLTAIGASTFANDTRITNILITSSLNFIGGFAFGSCSSLKTVYCTGNAPIASSTVFSGANIATIYYLPGTLGWTATFGGRPTALWLPQMQNVKSSLGAATNQFSFNPIFPK